MAILTKTEGMVVTPGLYLLELKSCDMVDGTNYQTKQPEKQLKWVWLIERVMEIDPSPDQLAHVGEEYWEWTSTICSPNSKTCARAETLMQRAIKLQEEVDTDLLLARRLKATFESYQKQNGTQGSKIGSVAIYYGAASMATATTSAAPIAAPANPTFTPITASDPRPSSELMARIKAAYEAAMAAKRWEPGDILTILGDLWGKGSSSELTGSQAQILLDILEDRQAVAFTPEGKYSVGLPF